MTSPTPVRCTGIFNRTLQPLKRKASIAAKNISTLLGKDVGATGNQWILCLVTTDNNGATTRTIRSKECPVVKGVINSETTTEPDGSGNTLCQECMALRKRTAFLTLCAREAKKQCEGMNDRTRATTEEGATSGGFKRTISNDKLTKTEQAAKLKAQAAQLKATRNRLAASKRTTELLYQYKENVLKHAKVGDIKRLAECMSKLEYKVRPRNFGAASTGTTTAGTHVTGTKKKYQMRGKFAADLFKNLLTSSRGASKNGNEARHCSEVKDLLGIVQLIGGPKVTRLLHENIGTPHERSISRHAAKASPYVFVEGLHESNIQGLHDIIKGILLANHLPIPYPVICEAAEDETGVNPDVGWDQATDQLYGFCGQECRLQCKTIAACRQKGDCNTVHQCDPNTAHGIGQIGDAYSAFVDAFEKQRKAKHARAIMLNFMDPRIPTLVFGVHGTCLAFTSNEYILPQWKKVQEMYMEFISPLLGPHLVGHASDGAPTRRKLMWNDGLKRLVQSVHRENASHVKPYGPGEGAKGWTINAYKVTRKDGSTHVGGLNDQDWAHCAKKLAASLDSASRNLIMGPKGMAHINDLQRVITEDHQSTHGLHKGDASRKGYMAMDVPSAIRIANHRAIECLKAKGGNSPTVAYLKMLRLFLSIWLSKKMDWLSKVEAAGQVVTFLRLWRQWVTKTNGAQTGVNFITREAFQDTLIACHCAVTMIMITRDYTPDVKLNLAKTGTDCVEDLWSQLGGMVENKRTYSILEAVQGIRRIQAAYVMSARGGISIPKNNKRLNIRDVFEESPDLRDIDGEANFPWPTNAEICTRWNAGGEKAREDAKTLGMRPQHFDTTRWWTHPHELDKRKKKDDSDDDDNSDDSDDAGNSDGNSDDDDDGVSGEGERGDGEQYGNGDDTDDDVPLAQLYNLAENIVEIAERDVDDEPEVEEPKRRITTQIFVPELGMKVHKATVIAYMQENKKLSADRIQRYREIKAEYKTGHTLDLRTDQWIIEIGSNVAVLFEKNTVYAGRIRRIRVKRKPNKGAARPRWVDYVKPVNLTAYKEKKATERPVMNIICSYYQVNRNSTVFTYNDEDPTVLTPDMLIGPINMKKIQGDGLRFQPDEQSMLLMHTARKGGTQF